MKSQKKSKPTLGKLKKKLWDLFSLYIKLKYSQDGYCNCFTCGANLKVGSSNCHGGHWLSKGGYPIHYFNENNVRPQCIRCNLYLEGNSEVFRRNLEREIGVEAVEEMYQTRGQIEKKTRAWYMDMIDEYQNKLKEIAPD